MWIARDKNGELFLFENKPAFDNYVFTKTSGFCNRLQEDIFPEVTFSNSPVHVSLTLDLERVRFDAKKFVDNETTPVETRSGKRVTIYSTKRENLYSVVGEIDKESQVEVWTATGRFYDEVGVNENDLMFCKKH